MEEIRGSSADADGLPMMIGTRWDTAVGGIPAEARTLLTDVLSPAESVGALAELGPVSNGEMAVTCVVIVRDERYNGRSAGRVVVKTRTVWVDIVLVLKDVVVEAKLVG